MRLSACAKSAISDKITAFLLYPFIHFSANAGGFRKVELPTPRKLPCTRPLRVRIIHRSAFEKKRARPEKHNNSMFIKKVFLFFMLSVSAFSLSPARFPSAGGTSAQLSAFSGNTGRAAGRSAARPAGKDPRSAYLCPLRRCRVVNRFHVGAHNWNPGNRGVDLAAKIGEEIFAPAAGKVVYAGDVAGRTVISILHGFGIRTTYESVVPSVSRGENIARGQKIGTVAQGRCRVGTCLHWGAKTGPDSYIDPMLLLSEHRKIRLYE